ncbi:MAG: hypothetical protein ABIO36_03590 [Pyrinomonadaceae bacterium]
MKKITFSRLAILGCCIALLTFASVTHTFGQSSPVITTLPVRVIADQSVVSTGGTMLARKPDGIFMTLYTTGLVPGTVATAWIAVFNTPAGCATNPCTAADMANSNAHGVLYYGGGKIIGTEGTANFGGFRAVGDTMGVFNGTFGRLIFPLTAEIHLVVRTHGVASTDPSVLSQQLTTFSGGCPPNTCSNVQISIHQQ